MHFGSAFLDIRKRYKIKRSRPQLWHFREHDFGFIQIPKVATRSIRQALFEIGAADGRSLRDRLPILGELPHVNKATHGRNFMGAYDHGTLEIAVARFRDDFELFGYDLP